jgi:retinol dehydrogenase 12
MPRIVGFVRDQYTNLPVPQPPGNIEDATYIVTGANTGVGLQCAKHLFHMGAKRIIMAVRSRSRGEAALAAIRTETGRLNAGEVWELDLTSLDSIEAFAQRIDTLDRLDGLIENAGVIMSTFQMVESVELSLFVNVVSTFLLLFRALPKLQESATKHRIQTHVTIVSSNSALESNTGHLIESLQGDVFDALSMQKRFKTLVQ